MGNTGNATEHTVQQILDKEIADEPDYMEVLNLILDEIKKMNTQLIVITGEEL